MATVTAAEGRARPAARDAAATEVKVEAPSRREFLYYIWGASMALLLGQATAGIIWFALPRFKEGTFGGVFNFPPEKVPSLAGAAPVSEPAGRFHVVRTAEDGFLALYGVCTHLGCLPKWQTDRFACPCHGSQFQLNGEYITGPAPRPLDRFATRITFADGSVEESNEAGDPIPLNGRQIARVEINTGRRLTRPNHA
jgi:cytochrome b6-f complex iron-sulfur subunit